MAEADIPARLEMGKKLNLANGKAGSGDCRCDSPSSPASQGNRENPAPLPHYENPRHGARRHEEFLGIEADSAGTVAPRLRFLVTQNICRIAMHGLNIPVVA